MVGVIAFDCSLCGERWKVATNEVDTHYVYSYCNCEKMKRDYEKDLVSLGITTAYASR